MKIPVISAEKPAAGAMQTPQAPKTSYERPGGMPQNAGHETFDQSSFIVPYTAVIPPAGVGQDVSEGTMKVASALNSFVEERQRIEDKSAALNLYADARDQITSYINQVQTSGEATHENYADLVREKLKDIKSDISSRGVSQNVMTLFADRFATTEVELHGQALQYQNKLFKDYHESSLRRYVDARRHDVTTVQPYLSTDADGQATIVDHAKTQQDEVIKEIRGYSGILGAEKTRELEQQFRESATAIRARNAMHLAPELFRDAGYKLFEADAKPETMASILAEADRLITHKEAADDRSVRQAREQLQKDFKNAGEAWVSTMWKRVESIGAKPVTGEEMLDFENNMKEFYDVIPRSEQRELRKSMQVGSVSRPSNPGLVDDIKLRVISKDPSVTMATIKGNDGLSLSDKTALAQFWDQRQDESDISKKPKYHLGMRAISIHFTGNPSMGMGEMMGAILDPVQRASYIRVMLEFDRRARTEYAQQPEKIDELAEQILERERKSKPGMMGGGGLGAEIGKNKTDRPKN